MAEKNNKKAMWWIIGLVAAAVIIGIIYFAVRPQTQTGSKSITVQVVVPGEDEKTFEYTTDEDYLGGLHRDNGLISGSAGSAGFYVTTVDGVTADDSKQQWWKISQNGTDSTTGVDDMTITNGDTYTFTLTEGY